MWPLLTTLSSPLLRTKVQDACAVPGLVVSPSEGVVPCGGKTALQVHFNPESAIKFDTRIEASAENSFSLE